jgi:hypothetical protein
MGAKETQRQAADMALLKEIVAEQQAELAKRSPVPPEVMSRHPSRTFFAFQSYDLLSLGAWLLDGQATQWHNLQTLSCQYEFQVFKRAVSLLDSPERNDPSFFRGNGGYINIRKTADIFVAWAVGEWDIGQEIAHLVEKHWDVAKRQDLPLFQPFARMMIDATTERWGALEGSSQSWIDMASAKDRNMIGYGDAMLAMARRDLKAAEAAIDKIVKLHAKEARKSGGHFGGWTDAYLCVWGVGLTKWMRKHGLAVSARPPLIPEDLVQVGRP